MINILKKLTNFSNEGEGNNQNYNLDSNIEKDNNNFHSNFGNESNLDNFSNSDESLSNFQEEVIFSLPIDLYQDNDNVYIKTFIPGVEPAKINLEIARDVVEISGERFLEDEIADDDFVQKELVWGKFEKRILLPDEVDITKIKASNRNGMLVLKMPKLDKNRKIKIHLN